MIQDVTKDALEAFFEAIPIRMSFIDTENNIRAMNSAAWQRSGVDVTERVGRSILTCHHQETAPKVMKVIEDLKSGQEKEVLLTFQSPDGQRAFREMFTAVRDSNGDHLGTLHLMYDVSEESRMRQQLEATRKD